MRRPDSAAQVATYNPAVVDDPSRAPTPRAIASRRCRSSFPPTTRPRTSRRSSPRRSRSCPRWPTSSRSSPSTTAARTPRPPGRRARCCERPGPRRPPRGQQGLRRCPAQRLSRRALRSRLLHRWRPPVQGGRPRAASRPHGTGPTSPTSWSATASSAPIRSSALAYARAYRLALRIFYRLGVRDVDCACKLFRARVTGGRSPGVGRRVPVGGAADQAQAAWPDDRRDRRAALPAHGRLGVRREPEGRVPRDPRLLEPAPAAVGEPRQGARSAASQFSS